MAIARAKDARKSGTVASVERRRMWNGSLNAMARRYARERAAKALSQARAAAAAEDIENARLIAARELEIKSERAFDRERLMLRAESVGVNSATSECIHAVDFTWVIWCGQRFTFSKGLQAECVRHLWGAWQQSGKRDGCGMSEKTVGERAGSSNDKFRLTHYFRKHEAMGTMIRSTGRGSYGLCRLESPKNHTL